MFVQPLPKIIHDDDGDDDEDGEDDEATMMMMVMVMIAPGLLNVTFNNVFPQS